MAKRKTKKKVSKKRVVRKTTPKRKKAEPIPTKDHHTKKAMHGSWFPITMRALILVFLGIFLLASPTITLERFLTTIGVIILAEGLLLAITTMIHPKEHEEWGMALFRGFLGILAGLFVLIQPLWWPLMAPISLAYIIAVIAIFLGFVEMIHSIQLHKHLENKYLMNLAGLLSLIFGALLIFVPIFQDATIIMLLGVYSIIFGVGILLFGFELKLLGNKI